MLLEQVEDDSGGIVLSKRKADRIRGWEQHRSDTTQGRRRRRGQGACARSRAACSSTSACRSSCPPRRSTSAARATSATSSAAKIDATILKIDEERRNIVISRRKLIEEEREEAKSKLLSRIEEGDLVKGLVKNIADFGAFVDLGGIDGLLHITDMSWGRVNHPSEVVTIDEEIEVKVLNIDRDKEKIALGLKQKETSPWEEIEQKYPVGCRVKGEVVNIMTYGAFVQLEEGIEGLVHISEMSWTRRINHPTEMRRASATRSKWSSSTSTRTSRRSASA